MSCIYRYDVEKHVTKKKENAITFKKIMNHVWNACILSFFFFCYKA